jgi:pseudaminic acid synthase
MSANHVNDFDVAMKTVDAAHQAGADAIKLQTYKPETLTIDVENEYFRPNEHGLWEGRHPYDLYGEACMPYEWQPRLKERADELGIDLFSSVFDLEDVDFLEQMGVPKYKIASVELNHIPLIRRVAATGKPVIMSTGVADLADIERAVRACRDEGNNQITLLQCTSEYPAPIEEANLAKIGHLRDTFGVKAGLSDHTLGETVPIASAAFGAEVIEKHFILDRELGGPDASFSLEPDDFARMVDAVKDAAKAIGNTDYSIQELHRLQRRSIFAVESIEKGTRLRDEHIRIVRPGHGLEPRHIDDVIGMEATKHISKGTPLSWRLIT